MHGIHVCVIYVYVHYVCIGGATCYGTVDIKNSQYTNEKFDTCCLYTVILIEQQFEVNEQSS